MLFATFALSACNGLDLSKISLKKKPAQSDGAGTQTSTTLVERDVEAPDVFQVTDAALWDGRPSLGGVWVAYPGDVQPERVIIRNTENKKFVIGALFKRERNNPGPKIQLSSDAAAALGVLAGKPAKLNITALRRESVPDVTEKPLAEEKPKDKSLGEIATAAIDKAEGRKPKPGTSPPPADTKPAAGKPASTLAKPYIQIGIFSIEKNARNTATSLSTQGVIPIVKAQKSKGKKFWRVLVGPATTKGERDVLLKKARALGFGDAYFVTN